jgi:excinuclease UvrABC nuclease subunit
MLSEEKIQSYLDFMENELMKNKNGKAELSSNWVNGFPNKPGTYVAFEDGKLVYVGETGSIRGRMRDLLDSRHHTLRRNIGKHNFSREKDYKDATTKKKFPKHIEEKVDLWFKEKITISILTTKLGRKELEERLVKKHNPIYNKKGQRISD